VNTFIEHVPQSYQNFTVEKSSFLINLPRDKDFSNIKLFAHNAKNVYYVHILCGKHIMCT